MVLSSKLWQDHLDLANESLAHPFVQGIADGTLPQKTFAYYVGQDAFFLEAFARAYSIAAAKAPTWQSFNVFHDLAAGVLSELKLHQSYAQTWHVDLTQVSPGKATRQYTDFLLATAWGQSIGVTAVAMSPCMRLYAYLGQQLAQGGIPEHTYGDWIATYSSDEFEPLAAQLEAIVDEYAADSALIRSTYRYAMVCERDFFQAAWRYQSEVESE
ncbi:TenA family protein [Leptolyngbyaceae cyanobacterium CCMR0082]|uniref:TenA family protein n=1 Tax=Adonisia turfae CCMR0082 TaxID=2304604 RepID=A0A6M0S348_9CYAN|nr:TenA family protein [Adonisia turfae]MDV3349412.1 TenA family protein [Leptothoe sp. LEGE 181152]NEZ62826.1 TenA family protein [Adonisia turfae CCMR0082]